MNREINKVFMTWLEDFWEEIEIQIFGIIGAILFFFLIYIFFQPSWMKPSINFIYNIKLFFEHFLSNLS